jgi:hypothetical protein
LGSTEGVRSGFHVLRSQTRFGQYRWRRVQFSSLALQDIFRYIPTASGPVFIFCAPRIILGGIEGIRSVLMFCAPGLIFGDSKVAGPNFHVLRSQNYFGWYQGR